MSRRRGEAEWLLEDWFDETCGHYRLRGAPRGYAHGEYDELRGFHAKELRRLRGAGYISTTGVAPDVLATEVAARYREMTTDELVRWYVRTALVLLDARQSKANYDRHARVAKASGHATYYARRNAQAVAAGFLSFWGYRQYMGWE